MDLAMGRAFAVAVVFVASALFAPRSARAEPPGPRATPVYVLSIWTNDSDDQADALTQQLRSRVRQAPGWSLLETTQSFETLAIALRCPSTPNEACLDRIGEQLHADHYVWGTMSKTKPGQVTADVHLWSRAKPPVEASETYGESLKDPSDDALRAVAARILAKLTGAAATGTLVVHAGAGAGAVLVDGAPKATLDGGVARLALSVGEHTIAVQVPGFQAESQTVSVADGGEEDASFALAPQAEGSPAGAEAGPSSPFPMRKVLAYSAIVAGAAFLVGAAIEGGAWLGDKNASDTDRQSIPASVSDVCTLSTSVSQQVLQAAADACTKNGDAKSASRAGWIFAGAGAVLATAGVVLLLTDPGHADAVAPAQAAARPRLDLLPELGPRAGMFRVRLTF